MKGDLALPRLVLMCFLAFFPLPGPRGPGGVLAGGGSAEAGRAGQRVGPSLLTRTTDHALVSVDLQPQPIWYQPWYIQRHNPWYNILRYTEPRDP